MKDYFSFSFLLVLLTIFFSVTAFGTDSPEGLQRFLQRYPEADLDGDGILSREEARTFRMKLWQENKSAGEELSPPVAAKERPVVTLGSPSYKDLAYGEKEFQRFDLWLPKGHPLPSPTLFYLSGRNTDGDLPARLFRDCLQEGWAVCLVYVQPEENDASEEQWQDSLADLRTLLTFFSQQAVTHGIRPDSLFLYASDALASYALLGNLLAASLEESSIKLRGTALYLSGREALPESLKSVMISLSQEHELPGKCALFHRTDLDPSWLVFSENVSEGLCSLHPISENETDLHILKTIFLFFHDSLKE